MMEKIRDYFNRYPVAQEVFENGGILFHTRGAADSYGKTDTTKYTRSQAEASVTEDEKPTESDPEQGDETNPQNDPKKDDAKGDDTGDKQKATTDKTEK